TRRGRDRHHRHHHRCLAGYGGRNLVLGLRQAGHRRADAEFQLRLKHPISEAHSGLMPANLMTLAHFSVSAPMNLPKSAGETTSGVLPPPMRCAASLGSARPALISRLSLCVISAGMFRGAPTPQNALAS